MTVRLVVIWLTRIISVPFFLLTILASRKNNSPHEFWAFSNTPGLVISMWQWRYIETLSFFLFGSCASRLSMWFVILISFELPQPDHDFWFSLQVLFTHMLWCSLECHVLLHNCTCQCYLGLASFFYRQMLRIHRVVVVVVVLYVLQGNLTLTFISSSSWSCSLIGDDMIIESTKALNLSLLLIGWFWLGLKVCSWSNCLHSNYHEISDLSTTSNPSLNGGYFLVQWLHFGDFYVWRAWPITTASNPGSKMISDSNSWASDCW